MSMAFYLCNSLSGDMVIDANSTEYVDCFYGVDFEEQNLEIKGKSEMIDELKATGKNK